MQINSPQRGTEHFETWLAAYKHEHSELLQSDGEFARWLEEEYVPLAGGWQY